MAEASVGQAQCDGQLHKYGRESTTSLDDGGAVVGGGALELFRLTVYSYSI